MTQTKQTNILSELEKAKLRGVPLVALTTQDQFATLEKVQSHFETTKDANESNIFRCPIISWDYINGMVPKNTFGKLALLHMIYAQAAEGAAMLNDLIDLFHSLQEVEEVDAIAGLVGKLDKEFEAQKATIMKSTKEPTSALVSSLWLPEDSIIFMFNFQKYLMSGIPAASIAATTQALMNLRNPFKAAIGWFHSIDDERSTHTRMLVLLTPEDLQLPSELRQDFLFIDEELPDEAARKAIILDCYNGADITEPDEDTLVRAIDATRGMSLFSIEQETALSLTYTGVDTVRLQQRAIKVINQQPGLKVWDGPESFGEIGGNHNLINYLKRLTTNNRPGSVFFIDEIEKEVSGASGATGDTSGVSQGMHGELLKWIVDKGVFCILFFGIGGCGKSIISKATGNFAGITTISGEIQAMKNALVGQSTNNLRNALKTVDAFSARYTLCLATTNDPDKLSPELLSRFAIKFYFPLPSKAELTKIWEIHMKLRGLEEQELPDSTGWVGRDVFNCCWNAAFTKIPLIEAAKYISPASVTARDRIIELDSFAENQGYISAADEGAFKIKRGEKKNLDVGSNTRKINVGK